MHKDRQYRIIFSAFLLSVVAVFLFMRPLHSPWHPFIAGDGLGYYAYLPAKFIYQDKDYRFEWFNKVYNDNYIYSTFENPEDNLLVKYGDKKINKYYQGLSYIWIPFFWLAHLYAKFSLYPADGFSQPYQLAMGMASLLYLLAGLYFLRKLILKLFNDATAAVIVPAAVFYGTWLFSYAISANTLSHVYSFTFLILFLYFLVSFSRNEHYRLSNLFLCGLFLVISICIRPLNGLIVLVIPAFLPPGFSFIKPWPRPVRWYHALIVLLALGALYHNLSISFKQTGSLIAYTYTGEKFDFANGRFFDALISYHLGLFVYVPLFLVSLAGVSFLPKPGRWILPAFFFFIVYLYSAWWYWPVVKRALLDFYVLPAVFLSALYAGLNHKGRMILTGTVLLCVLYFQFKSMQVRRGILDENATYKELFWRNFLRIKKTNLFPVPPHTIIREERHAEDFEGGFEGKLTEDKKYSGRYALALDSLNYISRVFSLPFPEFFDNSGFQKIRFSFNCYFEERAGAMHVFMQFVNRTDSVLKEVPFYINPDAIHPGKWDHREFGYVVENVKELNSATVERIVFTLWNVDAVGNIYIDDAMVELMLTDPSYETVQ